MLHEKPRLSIGLPVYNGEQYLAEAIDSILGQTFSDFELLISDNASMDGTQEICRSYAAKDRRICYYRNDENIGAMQNWYRTFQLSSGEYFLGAAHDDRYHPDFAKQCVGILDRDSEVVVCFTKTRIIDEHGYVVRDFDAEADITSSKSHVRLYNAISTDLLCIQLLGVFRSSAFRRTREFSGYYGCDRNVLAELSLLGVIHEVPEYLFYHRLYPQALGAARNSGRSLKELQLLDPGIKWDARFPTLTRFVNYIKSIQKLVPGVNERILCHSQLARIVLEKSWGRIDI